MELLNSKSAYLILANGKVFEGKSFGAAGTIIGEIVFTTSMTGYQETLTDPSYCGQIVTQTFPLIGNYGVNSEDYESKGSAVGGYIVREHCYMPSNFRSEDNIDSFLKKNGIIGLCDIDTRQLTRIIREVGVMNGMITSESFELNDVLQKLKDYKVGHVVPKVSVTQPEVFSLDNGGNYNIALIDYGYKHNIRRELAKIGCNVTVFPWNATKEEILAMKPDGIMLSNGPGDPEDNIVPIETIKELMTTNVPIFGICLGHQLVALANGAKTMKLKYGHRGANQPVIDIQMDRTFITSQNHGYAVVSDSVPAELAEISHINANDKTCEGIRYKHAPVFTVQFHPEAHGGPNDTAYLFNEFIKLMEEYKCH